MQHWKEGGHDTLCKKIKKAGGAEQYNAIRSTPRQYRSRRRMRGGHQGPDVLHLHAGTPLEDEGRARARVRVPRDGGICSCLLLGGQAKILVAEADENNKDSQWHRWYKCSLCEQEYHGVRVGCARVGVLEDVVGAEEDEGRIDAMNQLETVYTMRDTTRTH